MSTSRKLMVKLATHQRHSLKHRCAARKTPPSRPRLSRAQTNHLSPPSTPTGTQFCFVTGCRIQFVHLHISEPMPCPSGTQSQKTPGPSHTEPPANAQSLGTPRAGIVKNFCPLHVEFPL